MQIELKHIRRDRDRHGNERVYLRVPGQKQIRLREPPGSPAFLAEYQAGLAAQSDGEQTGGIIAGSLRWLCLAYYRTPEFRGLDAGTQSVRRSHLNSICASKTDKGAARGDLPHRGVKQQNVRKIRDLWAKDGPEAANGRVKALRCLYAWAVGAGHVDHNPARDVPKLKGNPEGFHTWTVEEVRQFEARHPMGTKARLALALLLFTGTRRSDVVTLGRQMARDGWLRWTETKARDRQRKERATPILPELQAVIDASPTGDLNYLETAFRKPFTAPGFGNKFREWCDQAGLRHCSAHGLRKAGATIAAERGATEHQLMAIFGWASPKQAAVYTKKANRRKLAGDSMHLIVPLPEDGCPTDGQVVEKKGA
jgi:integrase